MKYFFKLKTLAHLSTIFQSETKVECPSILWQKRLSINFPKALWSYNLTKIFARFSTEQKTVSASSPLKKILTSTANRRNNHFPVNPVVTSRTRNRQNKINNLGSPPYSINTSGERLSRYTQKTQSVNIYILDETKSRCRDKKYRRRDASRCVVWASRSVG